MSNSVDRLANALKDRYVIEHELGAGGMATVYLAQDVKHDRKVALKVMKPELAAVIGAERFLTEIKTTANLQHSHILPLHDSGEVNGTVFYVMPYIEGDTLRDRLNREKQLPIADAVKFAVQIADALDYAHRQGIVHRDIKPENILLHDDSALVMDFGIALAAAKTGDDRMTETGMSLGTPHYMSPEQAMGERELDARTDIYALGCVLYEMLTGEPPFTGATPQAIVAKVMTEDPVAITKTRRNTPDFVEAAILTAIEKLPADRFSTADEFGKALEEGRAGATGRTRAFGRVVPTQSNKRAWQVGFVILIVAALWGWFRPTQSELELPPSRLAVVLPNLGGASTALQRQVAITPDGSTLLYPAITINGENRTMHRLLHEDESTVMSGVIPYMAGYVVSQDGTEFFGSVGGGGRESYRYSMSGRSSQQIPSEVAWTSFVAWETNGGIWLSNPGEVDRGIAYLNSDGQLTYPLGSQTAGMLVMQVLPGDREALVVHQPMGTSSGPAYIMDLKTGETELLIDIPMVEIRYATGYLVYVAVGTSSGTMEAVPFDLKTRRIGGAPVEIANDVTMTGSGIAQFAVANNGTVAYIPEEPRSLVLVDREGGVRDLVPEHRNFHAPMFSPDGRRVSTDFFSADGRDVWVYSLDEGVLSRATFDRDGHDAVWTPDGEYLTYVSTPNDTLTILQTRPGTGESRQLFSSPQIGYTGIWLNDMSGLITVANALEPGSRSDIGLVTNGGEGPVEPIVATRFEEQFPAVSPDNIWIAFVSKQSGRDEVYVRSLEDGTQVQISVGGGISPAWNPSGGELFYRDYSSAGSSMVSASYRTEPTFTIVDRTNLFSVEEFATANPHRNYDVSPDGRHFVMVQMNPLSRVMVLQNLPALVEALRGNTSN